MGMGVREAQVAQAKEEGKPTIEFWRGGVRVDVPARAEYLGVPCTRCGASETWAFEGVKMPQDADTADLVAKVCAACSTVVMRYRLKTRAEIA